MKKLLIALAVVFSVATALDAIEAGEILITGAQEEKSQIANAIYACLLACNGYKVAPEQYIPMTLVTKDNVYLYR